MFSLFFLTCAWSKYIKKNIRKIMLDYLQEFIQHSNIYCLGIRDLLFLHLEKHGVVIFHIFMRVTEVL